MLHNGAYWALKTSALTGKRDGNMEGIKETGSNILQNVKTTLSGIRINPK